MTDTPEHQFAEGERLVFAQHVCDEVAGAVRVHRPVDCHVLAYCTPEAEKLSIFLSLTHFASQVAWSETSHYFFSAIDGTLVFPSIR